MKSLVKNHRDYRVLPQLIKKMDSSKYTLADAHTDIANLDLKQNCADIGSYIKKCMVRNCDIDNLVNLNQEHVSPTVSAELQPTSAAVKQSLILGKLLHKDRPFLLGNVEKYLCLYYNKL